MTATTAPEGVLIGGRYYRPPGTDYAYVGERTPEGLRVYVQRGRKRRPLHHVVYHSPTGMESGFGGSGPADLALSILCHALGERPEARRRVEATCAFRLYQAFKWQVISCLVADQWAISSGAVWRWLAAHAGRHAEAAPC